MFLKREIILTLKLLAPTTFSIFVIKQYKKCLYKWYKLFSRLLKLSGKIRTCNCRLLGYIVCVLWLRHFLAFKLTEFVFIIL